MSSSSSKRRLAQDDEKKGKIYVSAQGIVTETETKNEVSSCPLSWLGQATKVVDLAKARVSVHEERETKRVHLIRLDCEECPSFWLQLRIDTTDPANVQVTAQGRLCSFVYHTLSTRYDAGTSTIIVKANLHPPADRADAQRLAQGVHRTIPMEWGDYRYVDWYTATPIYTVPCEVSVRIQV